MTILLAILGAASLVGALYLMLTIVAVRRFVRRLPLPATAGAPPATVLKPLHGNDADLAVNLRSFCRQDYPQYQIVFAVREPSDAAIPVVERLIAELPGQDLALVVDPRLHGCNYKVSNLENALPRAKHHLLVIADSDMRVGPQYLAAVTAPLADPTNGLVTCLYRGIAGGGLWSRLGAMFVNHGFLPSALIGEWTQPGKAVFGATMALRRETLAAIGGFTSVRDQLADDYALGAAVRRLGQRIVLVPHLVDTVVAEASLGVLFRHELRWARTIRRLAPAGFAASIVTHAVVLALITVLIAGASPASLTLLAAVLACRLAMVRALDRALALPRTALWIVPLRDLLSFGVFVASFCGNQVAWRDRNFRVAADGRLVADGDTSA